MPFEVSSSPPEREPSAEGWKFLTLFGREPADSADKLPSVAKDKLLGLRTARDNARVVVKVPYDQMQSVNEKARAVQARIADLTNGATRYADNHPLVVAERESLERFKDEARRLSAEHERRKDESVSLMALVAGLESYVADLPKGVAAAPAIQPKPIKGESPEAAVNRIRDAIAKEDDNLFDAVNAPITSDAAKAIMRKHIAELAHSGRPNVLATVEGRQPPVFAQRRGEKIVLNGATDFLKDAIDVEATLAWLFRDQIIASMSAAIDEDADDTDALDDATRAKRIANAKVNILALSREEEFYITAAAQMGVNVARRPDCDPRAILQLSDSAPEPRGD